MWTIIMTYWSDYWNNFHGQWPRAFFVLVLKKKCLRVTKKTKKTLFLKTDASRKIIRNQLERIWSRIGTLLEILIKSSDPWFYRAVSVYYAYSHVGRAALYEWSRVIMLFGQQSRPLTFHSQLCPYEGVYGIVTFRLYIDDLFDFTNCRVGFGFLAKSVLCF